MAHRIRRETPAELFRELVTQAMEHQRVTTSEDSAWYLVQLLDSFVRPDRLFQGTGTAADRPLGEVLLTAVSADGSRRFTLFKLTGDAALFLTGFLSDSLAREIVDVDYYRRIGGYAYREAADIRCDEPAGALFGELSENFVRFADVLSEVSESCALHDDTNVLRLYEKWVRTGSPRAAALLRKQGILPVPATTTVH